MINIGYLASRETQKLCVQHIPKIAANARGFATVPFLARPYVNMLNPRDKTVPPWLSEDQLKYSQLLFSKPIGAHPVLVAQTIHNLPHLGFPQIAVVGKSNVGKSSLINSLMHGKEITRTSVTPNAKLLDMPTFAPVSDTAGRTRHLFTFDLSDHLSLVDLPGYGFAKVPKEIKNDWAILIEEYLNRTRDLKRVISLIEASVGPDKLDEKLWELMHEKNKVFMVVLTKVDLLQPMELHTLMLRMIATLQGLNASPDAPSLVWPWIHSVSSKNDLGIRELRCSLSAIASDHRLQKGKKLIRPGESPVRRIGQH